MDAGGGDPLPRALAALGLAALAAWTFWDRWQLLRSSPLPLGVDGYWYAVQLRSLLEGGPLQHGAGAAPVAMWLMAPLAAATDPIAGTKLGAALAAAALPVGVWLVARRATGDRATALLAAVACATSAGAFYLPTEFVKNEIGLVLALATLALLGRALDRPGWRRAAAPAALLVATAATHRLALAFAVAAAAPAVAAALVERGRRRAAAVVVAGAAAGAVAVLALAAAGVGPARGLLGGAFDPSFPALDLDHRALHFRGEPAWAGLAGAAALALALWGALAARAGSRAAAPAGPAAPAAPAAPVAPAAPAGPAAPAPPAGPSVSPAPPAGPSVPAAPPARDRALALGPAVWAVAVAWPWLDATDPDGLTFRLRAIAFLPLAIAGAAVAGAALRRLPPTARMTAAMFASGLLLVRPARYEAPVVRVHPDYAAAVAAADGRLPPGAVVVAPERQLVFMAAWYTRADARLRPEAVAPRRRWRLVPMSYMSEDLVGALAAARAGAEVGAAAAPAPPISLHRGHPAGLVLMPEATWERVLARLPAAESAHYRRWPTY